MFWCIKLRFTFEKSRKITKVWEQEGPCRIFINVKRSKEGNIIHPFNIRGIGEPISLHGDFSWTRWFTPVYQNRCWIQNSEVHSRCWEIVFDEGGICISICTTVNPYPREGVFIQGPSDRRTRKQTHFKWLTIGQFWNALNGTFNSIYESSKTLHLAYLVLKTTYPWSRTHQHPRQCISH